MSAISNIIACRLKEIIDLVMKEIKKSQCEGLCMAGIVITGGVSKMKGIKKFIEEQTKMEVKIGTPDHIVNDRNDEIFQPKYSTAVGLIICGFEHQESQSNTKVAGHELSNNENHISKTDIHKEPKPKVQGLWILIKKWLTGLWKMFIKYMNPQQEERND
jgi:cell division ATPase FtsA